MAKRGRPKGSLNKKTLEKIAKTAVKEESLPSAVDDAGKMSCLVMNLNLN